MEQQQILSYPVFFSFLLFLLILVQVSKKLFRNSSNPPPGPWKLPFLGNIHQLTTDTPHRQLTDLAKIYGPVMGIKLGQRHFLVISSPEAAKQVMKIQDSIFAERPLVFSSELLYDRNDIVFGSYGDQWRQMRKVCTLELLSTKRVQSFRSVREEEIAEFVKLLRSKEGSSVNLSQSIYSLTNSIVARNAVGHKNENQQALLDAMDDILLSIGGVSIADSFPSLKWLPAIRKEKARTWKLHRKTDRILEDIIQENRAKRQRAAKNGDRIVADNLLDVLLDLQEEGNFDVPLTDVNIKATIIDMFLGGSDTTSKTTEWAMAELMRSPEEMRKAQEELRNFFDEKGYVEEARLNEISCLKPIIKETLRLHPPAALIPRMCREKAKVFGYDVCPKTRVFINTWAIGRDPRVWSEAHKFKPERFSDHIIDYRGMNFELIPFGAGKRICPGITFGEMNLEILLANLLYHFDWRFPQGITAENLDMNEIFGVLLRRKIDLELIPIPRCSSVA